MKSSYEFGLIIGLSLGDCHKETNTITPRLHQETAFQESLRQHPTLPPYGIEPWVVKRVTRKSEYKNTFIF